MAQKLNDVVSEGHGTESVARSAAARGENTWRARANANWWNPRAAAGLRQSRARARGIR